MKDNCTPLIMTMLILLLIVLGLAIALDHFENQRNYHLIRMYNEVELQNTLLKEEVNELIILTDSLETHIQIQDSVIMFLNDAVATKHRRTDRNSYYFK